MIYYNRFMTRRELLAEDKVRVFTGPRVADPGTMFPRIAEALDKDGYKGKIALETHIFDGTLIAAAHRSMEEIMHIVGEI